MDVGSTFTDLVLLDTETGEVEHSKVLSTPDDQSEGFLNALQATGRALADFAVVVHGTTVATNAMIEGRGARVALVTTSGMRDVIELRNRTRPTVYGLGGSFDPLVSRNYRYDVTERLAADGDVLVELDERELRAVIERALRNGCEALAISFLHSYANDIHERKALAVASELWPNDHISIGSDLVNEIREFERTSTVVANAFVQPTLKRYLRKVRERLGAGGFAGDVLIVQSNGGLTSVDEAGKRAVTTALSGPAAGVAAAVEVAGHLGYQDFVSMDMGGTSLDLAVVTRGRPRYADQMEIRFGIPLRLPTLEIETIGIGGGSIAQLDDAGILTVGPASASSDPGPAAYGRGGTYATVTDANVVLGRIGITSGLGYDAGLRLRRDLAESAVLNNVGQPLGLDSVAAAAAILDVAVNAISGHIRRLTIERGLDPREYGLVAFGGGGPLHAALVMREIGLRGVIVPPAPGVLSAEGCAFGNVRYDYVQTLHSRLTELNSEILGSNHERAVASARARMQDVASHIVEIVADVEADLMFEGQAHALRVSLTSHELEPATICEAFLKAYHSRYGRILDLPVVLMNLRTTVTGRRQVRAANRFSGGPSGQVAQRGVHLDGRWVDVKVYPDTSSLEQESMPGPFIVEQQDATILVPEGVQARRTDRGGLILTEVQ